MTQLFSNNAGSSLSAAITSAATSMDLVSAGNLPTPTGGDYFLLTLLGLNASGVESVWEIIKCTARTNNTLTVVRAQEGTTGAAWPLGSVCQMRPTAGTFSAKADLSTYTVFAAANHLNQNFGAFK